MAEEGVLLPRHLQLPVSPHCLVATHSCQVQTMPFSSTFFALVVLLGAREPAQTNFSADEIVEPNFVQDPLLLRRFAPGSG